MICSVNGCNREADGSILIRSNEICKYHEKKHWKSKGTYIWKKLKLENETQLNL